jgi:hypothetical protein
MRKWSYLLPLAVLGFVLARYAVALAVAQAVAIPPSLEAAATAPQEWIGFSMLWEDDHQKGLLTLNELGGPTGAWSCEVPISSPGAGPLSGSYTSAEMSATPLPPPLFSWAAAWWAWGSWAGAGREDSMLSQGYITKN